MKYSQGTGVTNISVCKFGFILRRN